MKEHKQIKEDLNQYLKRLQLSTVRRRYEELSRTAQAESRVFNMCHI
jgi:hypothetical protein